jgi:hypothetical protein
LVLVLVLVLVLLLLLLLLLANKALGPHVSSHRASKGQQKGDYKVNTAKSLSHLKTLQDAPSGDGTAASRYARAAAFFHESDESFERAMLKKTSGKLSKKQLKQLPAGAKEMFKDGKFSNPKSDRSKR